MYPNNQYATIHERGHAILSDLDAWVLDPSKYEQERDAFVNDVVRNRIPLFPGESQAASHWTRLSWWYSRSSLSVPSKYDGLTS